MRRSFPLTVVRRMRATGPILPCVSVLACGAGTPFPLTKETVR